MSEPPTDPHAQSPDDPTRLGVPAAFAPGGPVPGLGSWLLERKLGGGGFGQVWLAKHAFDPAQPPRAVKFCTDLQARHRLVTHERNVVVRVMKYAGKHPNIVPLLEFNLDGPVPWLMYEFVEGGTLADLIDQWATLDMPERLGRAVKVLHGIASGLAACHRLSPPLVHRDMKPQNVLVAGAVPRVTDFGIGGVALASDAGVDTGTAGLARLPTELRASGTRLYAPPEQMSGAPPDPREDVYALGVIAYQLLIGNRRAAPGADAGDELRAAAVPEPLVALIARSAARNPGLRPADAGEWEARLAALVPTDSGGPSRPYPLAEATAPRRRARCRALAGLTVVLAAATALALWPPRERGGNPAPGDPPAVAKGDDGRAPEVPPAIPKGDEGRTSSAPPAAGAVLDVEVAPGVPMRFRWVPAGECPLGSPKLERDRLKDGHTRADPDEAAEVRGRFRTGGFWMGQYEVTQGQWGAVFADTRHERPSYFGGPNSGPEELRRRDTSNFPVENVSWDLICGPDGFLERTNGHGGVPRATGRPGRLRLPHEDEWEYACRGGLENRHPYHFGPGLNGTQANCNGRDWPFGTVKTGPDLTRPTAVGSYAAAGPHPWGLCDMHGNVAEWCANEANGPNQRAVRGGSWYSTPANCRTARRGGATAGLGSSMCGFRVCFHPD